MISPRFAPAVVVIAAFASIPTAIHSYRGLTINDGLTVAAIPERLADMPSRPTNRKRPWVESHFDSRDWLERTYRVDREEVRLFAARSYDAKKLYHHPELALLTDLDPGSAGRGTLPGRPDVPIHLLTTSRRGRKGVAVYTLLYDGRYIRNPILFQLRTSAELLVSGRKPMTLFLASDVAGSLRELDKAPSVRVLSAAMQAFEAAAQRQDRSQ